MGNQKITWRLTYTYQDAPKRTPITKSVEIEHHLLISNAIAYELSLHRDVSAFFVEKITITIG